MLDIKTPLSKCTRVSRKIDTANFVAVPGIWAKVNADGSLSNVATSVLPAVAKLVIGSASANQYESHDVEVGRITTLESVGARVSVDSDGFVGTPAQGDPLKVSAVSTEEGKLKIATSGTTVVAVCETYEASTGLLTYVIAAPMTLGTAGASGYSGATAASGYSGTVGTSGYSGASGTSGYSGT